VTGSAPTSDLTGWRRTPFTGGGVTHEVLEKGSGPGVVLVPEIPGVTPEVLGLAEHLVGQGFTVAVPSLFGTPGKAMSVPYTLGTVGRLCVSGGGIVGMCFTGGFALAAAVDEHVLASVVSQPAVPFPVSAARRADPSMSPAELDTVAARTAGGGLCVLGLRFSEDRTAPRERFATLRARLGDAFEVIELDSSPGNPAGIRKGAHSVLTADLQDEPEHPTVAARDRVVAFLRDRLTPTTD
jgi:dienelactone hydrolase